MSPSAVTECNSRSISDLLSNYSTVVECSLRNPTLAGDSLEMELFFGFNVSDIPLETSSVQLLFTVIDGSSGNETGRANGSVSLEAVGAFGISSV